jgi:hypothetical protein
VSESVFELHIDDIMTCIFVCSLRVLFYFIVVTVVSAVRYIVFNCYYFYTE